MKRILLTGISGFVGSHLLRHILQTTDWQVVGVVSWKHRGQQARLDYATAGFPYWKERVRLIEYDLTDPIPAELCRAVGEGASFVNLAASCDIFGSITDPVPVIRNNMNTIIRMLELAREMKPEVFLQFSTNEVYGTAVPGHKHEEWSSILPSNPYSGSKAAQEAIAISYWRAYNVPLIITNTVNLFGEMQIGEKFIPTLVKRILNGVLVSIYGSPGNIGSRSYLHTANCADAVTFLLKTRPALYDGYRVDRPDRYNISPHREIDNLELAEMVAGLLDRTLRYRFEDFHSQRPGHDRFYALSGDKLASLGWQPPMSFQTSLERTVKWIADNQSYYSCHV